MNFDNEKVSRLEEENQSLKRINRMLDLENRMAITILFNWKSQEGQGGKFIDALDFIVECNKKSSAPIGNS